MTRDNQFTERPGDLRTRPARPGAVSLTFVIGGLLWILVIAALIAMWQLKRKESVQSSPQQTSTQNAATARDAATAVEEQSGQDTASAAEDGAADDASPALVEPTVKLSFPARHVPDFEFDESEGGTVSKESLMGRPWVASFVFTRCMATCPTISMAMKRLHDRVIKENADVQFVTFTVDPEFDTVDVLKQYSDVYSPDRSRWKFVTGNQDELFSLIINGFGLYVKENLGESRRPGFEVAHSNRVVLVNEEGVPVGTFLATNDDDMAALRQILTGQKPFPEPGPPLTITAGDGSPVPLEINLRKVDEDENGSDEDSAPETPDADSADSNSDGDLRQPEAEPQASSEPPPDDSAGHSIPASVPVSVAEHNARVDDQLPGWARPLPAVNASLNGLATCLLASGYIAVRSGNHALHRNLMLSALLTSVVFLTSYLVYHYALGKYTGTHGRKFSGEGIWAAIYPLVLWPHVILAATVPFLAIGVVHRALAREWEAHKRLARVTFPIWMYVSVTGVLIYGMLYHWPETAG
ncbi:MAG: DUF420 domain-containing protein [Planctomycetaceae bacterium]